MPAAASTNNAHGTALAMGEVLADAASGDRFRVTGFIGKGAMGEVYLGVAEGSGAAVAIKTIPLALADDPKVVIRTRFESAALRDLRHRNVVPVFASGTRRDGIIFMVMQYLPGMTLLELRRTQGRIPIPWSLQIVRDACRGLEAIHAHAVHRDVKPANLHFGVDAVVRVLDLGAAKWKRSGLALTSAGTQPGTLPYMAPEVLDDSAPVSAQADVWSAGVVLYELLAGRNPFAVAGQLPDNPFVLGNRIIEELHVPLRDVAPLCPGFLAQIVDRTLAKDPRDRYRSAAALEHVLSEAMAAFAREHGAAPPLEELAARAFPSAARRGAAASAAHRPSGAAVLDVQEMQKTAPLGPEVGRAQPEALPYLRTEDLPPSAIAAALRSGDGNVGKPEATSAPSALSTPEAARSSEPEPPRVSDVFPRRLRVSRTLPDPGEPAPATVRDAPVAGARVELAAVATPTRRRAAVLALAALTVFATGLVALALALWGAD